MSSVVLVVLALAAGLTVGYARRGRLHRLAEPPPARNRLLLTALAFYVLGIFGGWAWEPALPLLSAIGWLVIAFYAWVNRWMPGGRLVALGVAANALVLLFNGATPVSPEAAERAGADMNSITSEYDTTLVDESTRLSWLAKTIPVAFPPRPEVVSPGDVAIAAGLATIVATGMTGRRPQTNAPPATRSRGRVASDDDTDDHDDAEAPNNTAPGPDQEHPASHDATNSRDTMDDGPDTGTRPIRRSATA